MGREVQRRDQGGGSQLSAGEELVAAGAAVVRIENEQLMQVALQRPREPEKICAAALAELELAPELAEKAYYTLPFKNHKPKCPDRKNCDCPTKYVRDIGIDGALMLVRHWRNCAATVRIIEDDVESTTLEGVFLDFESNVRLCKPKTVSKFGRRKGGSRYRLYDSELEKQIAAAASKAQRNAMLDGIPEWIKHRFYERARELAIEHEKKKAAKGKPMTEAEQRRALGEKIVSLFAEHEVSREMLEEYLGCELEQVDDEQRGNLRGILNALDAREMTVREIFGVDDDEDEAAANGTVDDVLGAGADVTAGAEAAREKPEGPPNDEVDRGGRRRPKQGRRGAPRDLGI